MKTLNINDLIGDGKREPTAVECPELGGEAYIATLSPDELDLLELQWVNYKKSIGEDKGRVGMSAFSVTWLLCDKENKRLNDPGTDEGILSDEFITVMKQLGSKGNGEIITRLFAVAARKTGLVDDKLKQAKKKSSQNPVDGGNGGRLSRKEKPANNGSVASKP